MKFDLFEQEKENNTLNTEGFSDFKNRFKQ